MGWRMAGGNCCCCKDTVLGNEQRQWCESAANGSGLSLRTVASPTKIREQKFRLNLTPAGGSTYSIGTAAPDWKNERFVYSYQLNVRDSFNVLIGENAVVRSWNLKGNGGTPVHNPQFTVDIAAISDYLIDSIACDPDEGHIYYTGHAYPYPTMSANYSIEFRRMDYDGTSQTLLDTVQLFRTGSSTPWFPGVGSMLLNRPERRLYFVVIENVTTSTAADWIVDIRYRDLGSFAETTIYSQAFPRLGTQLGDSWVRMISCLSFDFENKKIYWVESYRTTVSPNRLEGKVKRANYDGSNVETLVQAIDPLTVNFARYSNQHKKIIHGETSRFRTTANPLPGVWVRNPYNWNDAKLVALEASPEIAGLPYPGPVGSFLWCGYERIGPHAVC